MYDGNELAWVRLELDILASSLMRRRSALPISTASTHCYGASGRSSGAIAPRTRNQRSVRERCALRSLTSPRLAGLVEATLDGPLRAAKFGRDVARRQATG